MSLAEQIGLRGPPTVTDKLGNSLNEADLSQLRDEQIHQLYELMLAAQGHESSKSPNIDR